MTILSWCKNPEEGAIKQAQNIENHPWLVGNVYDNLHEPQNYCLKCWEEFTTLTEEERAVFKYLKMKMHKTKKTFDYYEE